jgi:phosphoribosylformimino-5-aminoimidazole carboxamide ribotide isomerase
LATFEVLPAIDLEGGRVVRLAQGDFDRETVYEDDAVRVAQSFADAGAGWLHVVDLDGARLGEPKQLRLVAQIVAEVHGRARVEVGGGLRTAADVAGAIGAGASRVSVGTAALRNPSFVLGLVARYGPARIACSLDIRDGMALGEGWRQGAAGVPAADALERLSAAGIDTFAVTAIERDGMLGGPDLALLRSLVALGRGRIIASGGISSLEDILAVQAAGCGGAIIGRALYEGRVTMGEIVTAIEGRDPPH